MSKYPSPEFDDTGTMKWERVIPPDYWKSAGLFIVADRHLPNGKRQHIVIEDVPEGTEIGNADVFSQSAYASAEYSSKLSHLSRT